MLIKLYVKFYFKTIAAFNRELTCQGPHFHTSSDILQNRMFPAFVGSTPKWAIYQPYNGPSLRKFFLT